MTTPGERSRETPISQAIAFTAREHSRKAEAGLRGDWAAFEQARRVIADRLDSGHASPWFGDLGPAYVALLAGQARLLQYPVRACVVAGQEARERERAEGVRA